MARRNRTRPRSRRDTVASRHATTARSAEREATPRTTTGYRARGTVTRAGYSRAAGTPSAALERASLIERAYVAKDFRRLAITVVIALALLVAAGLIESAVLGR